MKKAYETVESWFEKTIEENEEYSLETEMTTYLLKHCKVIWYEVDEDVDAEAIFTRLNIGKIPLTNAELIKALLLKKSNYSENGTITYLRQMEIATEWDMIENTLQDDGVWYFINPRNPELDVRIEYIFDSINYLNFKSYGEFATFYKINEMLKVMTVDKIWKKVKDFFQTIMEWYNNQQFFHLIGFLTSRKITSIEELRYEYKVANNYTKSELLLKIKQMICARIAKIGDIGELDYDDDYEMINTVLLLFNVLTVMNKGNAYSRFRFDEYQKNQWSLEHIHAQNAEGILNSTDAMRAWVDEHLCSFKSIAISSDDKKYEHIIDLLENFDKKHITQENFKRMFDEICKEIESDYGTDLNNISNLALLEKNKNSILSNSFFDVKRRKIIEMDKDGEFIPVCTRNVFLKYYSSDASQHQYWSKKDRADYLLAIKETLKDYLPEDYQ